LFNGTGAFPWIGLAFGVVGLAFFASILLTPGGWQWWMDAKAVQGTEQNGIISYSYRGATNSIDDPNSFRTGNRTVYLLPSDPSNAELHNAGNVILDWGTTGGPLLLGTGFVIAGFIRKNHNSRRRRRVAVNSSAASFGAGLDSETVRRLIADQKGDRRNRPVPRSNTQDQSND
jgi:hypothetical protein